MVKKRVKSIFILFFVLMFAFFLSSCGNKKKTTEKTTTDGDNTTHEHVFSDWQQVVRATCTEEGLKKRTCSCGKVEYEAIPLTDHNYVDDKCSDCGFERMTDGFIYDFFPGSNIYYIKGYNGTSTSARICTSYDDGTNGNHDVYIDYYIDDITGQAYSALANANIKKLYLSDDFTIVPDYVFSSMENLEEVVLSNYTTAIGRYSFSNCQKLNTITFGDSLQSIGYKSFENCGFTSLKMPYNLTDIFMDAFSNCSNLTSVTFNSNLKKIGVNAFNNTKIESIKISLSLEAFGYQTNLPYLTTVTVDPRSSIFEVINNTLIQKDEDNRIIVLGRKNSTIDSTVTGIGEYAFSNIDFSSIDTFVIPSNIKFISSNSFNGSTFNNIQIEGVEVLGENAFSNVTINGSSTKTLTLPSTLKTIYKNAFKDFSYYEIIIPSSVTYLDEKIFNGCNVSKITIYQSTLDSEDCNPDWNVGIDTTITEVTIIDDTD